MSTAQQVIYADTFVEGFEQKVSILRETVTTKTIAKGGQFFFLVASSGGAAAVTRGPNGLIPARDDAQTQVGVTLKEAHDLQRKTGFDIFRGQADQQAIMRMTGMKVINREIDNAIINAAVLGTVAIAGAVTLQKAVANTIATKLGNAFALEDDMEGEVSAVVTPAAWAYLTDITSFASSLYTERNKGAVDRGVPQPKERGYWMGMWWYKSALLPGVGTNAATCVVYHKAALGHAVDRATIAGMIGRDEEQDYSWARHSVYHGAQLLQNAGIVKFTHDDSAYS